MAAAFGTTSALDELQRLREQAAPRALRDFPCWVKQASRVGAILTAMPSDSPTPGTAANLKELLLRAWRARRKEAR